MSSDTEQSISEREFIAFCEAEFDRRANDGVQFEREVYEDAMKLVLQKLRQQGGKA
jgi:hypothetical protein